MAGANNEDRPRQRQWLADSKVDKTTTGRTEFVHHTR